MKRPFPEHPQHNFTGCLNKAVHRGTCTTPALIRTNAARSRALTAQGHPGAQARAALKFNTPAKAKLHLPSFSSACLVQGKPARLTGKQARFELPYLPAAGAPSPSKARAPFGEAELARGPGH